MSKILNEYLEYKKLNDKITVGSRWKDSLCWFEITEIVGDMIHYTIWGKTHYAMTKSAFLTGCRIQMFVLDDKS